MGTIGRGIVLFSFRIIFHLAGIWLLSYACSAEQNSSLFFIFSDSLVDVGNSNFIDTLAKGNFYPHGIYFGKPTGRFTNGRTAFDIIEQTLGSKNFTPPYLDPVMTTETMILRGANYVSSGSGFLNETGAIFVGGRIGFQRQIDHHLKARQAIISVIGRGAAKTLLQRAMYVIAMGSNDLLYERATTKQRGLHSPDEFLDYLMSTIRTELIVISLPWKGIDAWKMPFCCIPFTRDVNSMPGNGCVSRINARARSYNNRMKDLLVDLTKELEDPVLRHIRSPRGSAQELQILQCSPKSHYTSHLVDADNLLFIGIGFTNVDSACCAIGGVHVFWDLFRLSESSNRIAPRKLLYGRPNYISPINIKPTS